MAECRCGTCEHCVTAPRVPRELLARTELDYLRGDVEVAWTRADRVRILSAYETAVRLLEECVREATPRRPNTGPVHASDVAWLALREAER